MNHDVLGGDCSVEKYKKRKVLVFVFYLLEMNASMNISTLGTSKTKRPRVSVRRCPAPTLEVPPPGQGPSWEATQGS